MTHENRELNEVQDATSKDFADRVPAQAHHPDETDEPCLIHRIHRGLAILATTWESDSPITLEGIEPPDDASPYADAITDTVLAAIYAGADLAEVMGRVVALLLEMRAEPDVVSSASHGAPPTTSAAAGGPPAGAPHRRIRIADTSLGGHRER